MSLFYWLSGQAQLTVFAGPQLTTAAYSIQNINQPASYKTGFSAGLNLRTNLEGPACFAPSLSYTQKGYKVTLNRRSFPPDSAALNNNTTIGTIELAPLIQINLSKSPSYAFVRFGPSIAFAISGKETFDSTGGKKITRDMPFGYEAYSTITTSVIIQAGFQHKSGVVISGTYQYGLSSLNNSDGGPYIRQTLMGLSVGWRFGKKR